MSARDSRRSEQFFVRDARAQIFERMPAKLKKQFAYRHFYTDTVDPVASCLSTKFFSLLILYFCSIFRLEGRRRQYSERETGKSGRDFSKAHAKARLAFDALSRCYGSIVMRYNCHNMLEVRSTEVEEYQRAQENVTKAQQFPGRKNPFASVTRQHAFEFASDELVFFEMLYQSSVQITNIAFDGDASIQALAEQETNRMFRSGAFLFHQQKRSTTVKKNLVELDKKAKSFLENNHQLAELLTPAIPAQCMRLASQQRTPFVACSFPGVQSTFKYSRIKRPNGVLVRSVAEKDYSVETKVSPFPPAHRAKLKEDPYTSGIAQNASVLNNDFSITVGGCSMSQSTNCTIKIPIVNTSGLSSNNIPTLSVTPLSPGGDKKDKSSRTPLSPGKGASSRNLDASVANTMMSARGNEGNHQLHQSNPDDASLLNRDENAVFEAFLMQPLADWNDADLYPEISAIYQALANGVVVTNFCIPSDMLLTYDDDGILISAEET